MRCSPNVIVRVCIPRTESPGPCSFSFTCVSQKSASFFWESLVTACRVPTTATCCAFHRPSRLRGVQAGVRGFLPCPNLGLPCPQRIIEISKASHARRRHQHYYCLRGNSADDSHINVEGDTVLCSNRMPASGAVPCNGGFGLADPSYPTVTASLSPGYYAEMKVRLWSSPTWPLVGPLQMFPPDTDLALAKLDERLISDCNSVMDVFALFTANRVDVER